MSGSLAGTPPRRGRRRLLAFLLVPAALLLAIPWLPRLLSVAERESSGDLLYVFPGALPERPRCAALLYREGRAPRLLFSGGKIAPELEAIGRPLSDALLLSKKPLTNSHRIMAIST